MSSMHEIRLKMLRNGYVPLLNKGKRPMHRGWQNMRVDEATIMEWQHSTLPTTGVRVEGGLAVVDIDVTTDNADLIEGLARRAETIILPKILTKGLVRLSTGHKAAWFCRVAGPLFPRLASRLWMRPGDEPDDGDALSARVEIFGGGSSRQFGAFGAHTIKDGVVISSYSWAGPSLADVALSSLPIYPLPAFGALCNTFDEEAEARGLVAVAKHRESGDPTALYTLLPDTVVELEDGSTATVAELEKIAPDFGDGEYMRCSGTFHDRSRVRRNSHTIAIGRHGIGIFDFMELVTYHRADRKPPDPHEIGEKLKRAARERVAAADAKPEPEPETDEASPPQPDRQATPMDQIAIVADAGQTHRNAVDWLLQEMAWASSAFMARGGIVPIYPGGGEPVTVNALRTEMRAYDLVETGPRGGIKRISPIDAWLTLPEKVRVAGWRMRPQLPRPLFREGGHLFINTYAPPAHLTQGGELATFERFLERLIPDVVERAWFLQWLAHKVRAPWVPMVAIIMVAREYGTGRGTLGEILGKLFGETYVKPCDFAMFTGSSAAARFNTMFADALVVLVNEATEEDGHRWHVRRSAYEALKSTVDPNGSMLRRYEAKGQNAYFGPSAMSTIVATNNLDAVKLPENDRRFCVITNSNEPMTSEEREELRQWMADPTNIGALYRRLGALPADATFDPYWPPRFAGKRDMIELAQTDIDQAYATARVFVPALFTMTQILALMEKSGEYLTSDWARRARVMIPRRTFRVRGHSSRISYRGKPEAVYAKSEAGGKRFAEASPDAVRSELDETQKVVNKKVRLMPGAGEPSGDKAG
jgi:hypothetical protein